jgi:hypothetical protein
MTQLKPGGESAGLSLGARPAFMTRCHLHRRKPERGCRECGTAIDVNFQGHRKGTCITAWCWWHNNPGGALMPVPMLSWER